MPVEARVVPTRTVEIVTPLYLAIRYIGAMFQFISGYVMGARNASRATGLASSAAQFTAQPQAKLYDLADRIDRLTMVMEAMWSLLVEQGFTEEQLAARIEELDMSDGSMDGRKIPPADQCPECGAVVSRGVGRCQFCGHETGESNPFHG